MTKQSSMARNIVNHTREAKLLTERAVTMEAVRGVKETESTRCVINIHKSRKEIEA